MNGELFRYNPENNKNDVIAQYDEPLGTVVQRDGGGLVAAYQSGLYAIDEETGERSLLAAAPTDDLGIRFNDGKCDPAGRLWVGTMATDGRKNAGALYRFGADRKLHAMIESVTTSNGIIWSPDRRTMYYADTPTGEVWAFDYDEETGDITNRRTAVKIDSGGPDGMTIDSDGMLWVAQWGGWQVGHWDPTTGKKLGQIDVPARQVSSCAFGGKDLDTLYITSAAVGTKGDEQPLAGSLFAAKLGVKGIAAYRYKG